MMHAEPTSTIDTRRAAARRTAWIMAGVALTIFGLFWLSGIAGR